MAKLCLRCHCVLTEANRYGHESYCTPCYRLHRREYMARYNAEHGIALAAFGATWRIVEAPDADDWGDAPEFLAWDVKVGLQKGCFLTGTIFECASGRYRVRDNRLQPIGGDDV